LMARRVLCCPSHSLRCRSQSPSSPLLPYTTLFRSVEITGNVGFINEKRVVGKDNKSVIEFGVIVNHPKKDEKGEYRDDSPSTLQDRKSTRLNSSHVSSSYAVVCLDTTTPRGCQTLT